MDKTQSDLGVATRLGLTGRRLVGFTRFLTSRFVAHDSLQNAAALTYTTLLSLVPLMTVILAVFSAFPVAERVSDAIQDFLFANFLPASGEIVQSYLHDFSSKASRLTGAGFAFLIVVALLMMSSIDRALNAIWEVRVRRSPINKFVVYWAILSIGPLLIGASVLATSYLISLPYISDAAASSVGRRLLGLTPITASAMGFTLIYALVPNRRVSLLHAVAGGVLAALLFELAKRGFGWYLTTFPTYEAIYGALATIPIFLVWVYLSWLVLLLGAEFTHCLGIFHTDDSGVVARRLGLVDAVAVLLFLGRCQAQGESVSVATLSAEQPHWREQHLEELLNELLAMHLVHRTDSGEWALARDLNHLTLADIARSRRLAVPFPGDSDWPTDPELAAVFTDLDVRLTEQLQVPLRRFAPAGSPLSAPTSRLSAAAREPERVIAGR